MIDKLTIAIGNGVHLIALGNGRLRVITSSAIPHGDEIVLAAPSIQKMQEVLQAALEASK